MARKWENAMTLDKRSWGYRRNGKLHEYYSIKVKLQPSLDLTNELVRPLLFTKSCNSLNQIEFTIVK